MRVTNPTASQNNSASSSSSTSGTTGLTGQSAFAAELAKLQTFVSGTPAEQMRTEILAQLGYTEDELKAMSPKDRAAAEKKIADLMQKEVEIQTQRALDKQTAGASPRIGSAVI